MSCNISPKELGPPTLEVIYCMETWAPERFIDEIQTQRSAGYGFVPVIGAGFSAPSGAPLVEELLTYLQHCIVYALSGDQLTQWRPRTDQWPPFTSRWHDSKHDSPMAEEKLWGQTQRLLEKGEKTNEDKTNLITLKQAIGAIAEWRTALLFLSRLKHAAKRDGNDESAPLLMAPRPEIIDACFRKVLENKHPALNHRMLGVLAGALRLDIILTTNFDDLLERAFAYARNPLQVFEVHPGETLPHWSAVSGARSLIKLHGNRHLLRADYSLDSEPSEHDKDGFLAYLRGEHGRPRPEEEEQGREFQNHLLVMGASGSDARTRALIKHASKNLDDKFRVFWICYSDEAVASIGKFAEGCRSRDGQERVVVVQHTNYGLLLLQLYQVIRRNLPPFGGLFPSVSRLTLPPLPSVKVNDSGPSLEEDLAKLLEKNRQKSKLIVVTSNQDVRGITSACSRVFSKMESQNICLWLDMNDISSTDDLFEVLLEAAYFRLGQENWVPTYHETQKKYRTREIERLVSSVDRRWIIFLNARETPGANTDDRPRLDSDEYPNGWLDVSRDADADRKYFARFDDSSKCTEEFAALVENLGARGISVVLMCREGKSRSRLTKRLEDHQKCPLKNGMREVYPFSELDVAAKAIVRTEGNKCKQRFLHSLVLMQRPRLLATIWSDAVCLKDDDERTSDEKQKWLVALEEAGLARRKLGGFIWLHSRTRELMRKVLWGEQLLTDEVDKDGKARTFLKQWDDRIPSESEIHRKLARWYEKVLDASEAPAAVFEAVTHLCRAAKRDLTSNPKDPKVECALDVLDAASALLRTNSFLIQTHGYARGSCRRLIHIRGLCRDMEQEVRKGELATGDKLIRALRGVQIACTEVMRSNAREVGEDKKAFIRHQQFGFLSAGEDLVDDPRNTHIKPDSIWTLLLSELKKSDEHERASVEWVRWWRWAGMLGSSSRSYAAAEKSFKKALQCTITRLDDLNVIEGDRDKLLFQLDNVQSQELRLEALKTIEQYTELLLMEYGLDARLRSFPKYNGGVDRNKLLTEIQTLLDKGRELAQAVRGHDQSSVSQQTIEANWCDCRLLIHQSTLTSRHLQLSAKEDPPRHESVMGILGDAEAGLRLSDPRRHRSELGIVELHRAEARLRKAEAARVGIDQSKLLFSSWCRDIEDERMNDDVDKFREKLKKHCANVNKDRLQRVRSLASDSMRFLDRAEPILRERRRNVWWTTLFFERYLRSIAISVWACILDEKMPVPFLGLESAIYDTTTLADELIEDSLRMISVDAYRLATVIDAYASCAKALQVRIVLYKNTDNSDPEFRLARMQKTLENALNELGGPNGVQERRAGDSALEAPNDDSAMDALVVRYVESVIERSVLICTDLSHPI